MTFNSPLANFAIEMNEIIVRKRIKESSIIITRSFKNCLPKLIFANLLQKFSLFIARLGHNNRYEISLSSNGCNSFQDHIFQVTTAFLYKYSIDLGVKHVTTRIWRNKFYWDLITMKIDIESNDMFKTCYIQISSHVSFNLLWLLILEFLTSYLYCFIIESTPHPQSGCWWERSNRDINYLWTNKRRITLRWSILLVEKLMRSLHVS